MTVFLFQPNIMELAETDFAEFFQSLNKQGLCENDKLNICRTLYWQNHLKHLKISAKIMGVLVLLFLGWHSFDCISWFLSAVFRVILIQLLPYWNWTSLYNSKCLIERNQNTNPLSSTDIYVENCLLCETMENVPTASNVTFSFLEWQYLDSGLPVIITDSHLPKDLEDILQHFWQRAPELLTTEPCDIVSNLMLRHRFNMELALQKMNSTEKGYLQFRNCIFRAIKWSRLLIEKPYYYPVHLEPFYSSWFIMSRNFMVQQVDIYVKGLILVQQWQGFIEICLKAKRPCIEQCPDIKLRLMAGEALIFSTDLWTINYSLTTKNNCLTSIVEIDWQI